jgi:hypothetical protein
MVCRAAVPSFNTVTFAFATRAPVGSATTPENRRTSPAKSGAVIKRNIATWENARTMRLNKTTENAIFIAPFVLHLARSHPRQEFTREPRELNMKMKTIFMLGGLHRSRCDRYHEHR